MSPVFIVRTHPFIDIGLQLFPQGVQLAPDSAGIKLIPNDLVKPRAATIGLGTFNLGVRVIDALKI